MVFYDCRCMVTGIGLMGDTSLVALRRTGRLYHPISLGFSGTYNRLGSIDGVEDDLNTDLVLTYFQRRLSEGALVVTEPGYPPIEDIEELLYLFARNSFSYEPGPWQDEPAVELDGDRIVTALIAQPVWDAVVRNAPPSPDSAEELFERVFGDCPTVADIYRARLPELDERIRQLHAISEFLVHRGQSWAASPEPSQRYPTSHGMQHGLELFDYLADARRDFADVEPLRAVFDEHEKELNSLVGGERPAPEPLTT